MKDIHGFEFKELVTIQDQDLAMWQIRIKSSLFGAVSTYTKNTNVETFSAQKAHRVYRGQDLVQIICDWPNLKPCYEPLNDPISEEVI